MWRKWEHLSLVLTRLPGLIFRPRQRKTLADMLAFCRSLPQLLKTPLPDVMRRINSSDKLEPPSPRSLNRIRELADLAAFLERRSPLGLCLRRSLTRFHFLRKAGLPVRIHFGAKFLQEEGKQRVAGHAWLTLNGLPYHEAKRNWKDFQVMLSFPEGIEPAFPSENQSCPKILKE